ncbi:hepatitis A virus cellular receptor 1 homolog [Enoplosus armatus]|uniref:hepatitis A virus cellular receptor 1 homolog n=1 Tax=Enoplosus armatus TaxID=215367 RepID=UPI003995A0E9
MEVVLLLALFSVSECVSSRAAGQTGQNVSLSCKYDLRRHGRLSVCWGRGDIPASGCNNQLVSTDGLKVVEGTRTSSRYQLLGRLDEGDASLTILNLTETDAGRYGCRVEVPGWFNDDKHLFDLIIERGQLTSTQSPTTSSFSSIEAEGSSSVTVLLVCVLLGMVALVTAGGLIIIARRWRRLNKIPQQQVYSSVQFGPTSSTLQLHSRGSAVENIYQIDGGGDGGEYEYCP